MHHIMYVMDKKCPFFCMFMSYVVQATSTVQDYILHHPATCVMHHRPVLCMMVHKGALCL